MFQNNIKPHYSQVTKPWWLHTFLEFAECSGNVNELSLNLKEIHLEMIWNSEQLKKCDHKDFKTFMFFRVMVIKCDIVTYSKKYILIFGLFLGHRVPKTLVIVWDRTIKVSFVMLMKRVLEISWWCLVASFNTVIRGLKVSVSSSSPPFPIGGKKKIDFNHQGSWPVI